MKIAIGGFQHETNSFSSTPTTYQDFLNPGGWPGLLHGAAIFDRVTGMNLPIAGFIAEAGRRGAALVPLLWANAQPAGPVTSDAFERIAAMLLAALIAAEPFDAVYLDLHGAMITADFADGEGEVLRRVRAIIGAKPLVISLDWHANISRQMVEFADYTALYRTYPHLDFAATGGRAAAMLLDGLLFSAKEFRQGNYLIPLTAQPSEAEPMRSLSEHFRALELKHQVQIEFAAGFPPGDCADCGPSLIIYARTPGLAHEIADRALSALSTAEPDFSRHAPISIAAAIEKAQAFHYAGKPLIFADTQDNPGAGAPSNTTGLLHALHEAKIASVAIALFYAPEAALAAHQTGIGNQIMLTLGDKAAEDPPFQAEFTVLALSDGKFAGSGTMWQGATLDLGLMARVGFAGIEILIASKPQQPSTQAIFTVLGCDATAYKILVLKSSVHFRADFASIAAEIVTVAAPGLNIDDPSCLDYRNLRTGVRRKPLAKLE